MIESNFLSIFKNKIDKLDFETIKKILYEVLEENENLKTLFNSMKEAVIVLDKDGVINFYNKMAVKILEFSSKKIIDQNYKEAIENEVFKEILETVLAKEEKIENYEVRLDFEKTKYISFSVDPLVHNGKIVGNIIILEDITDQITNKNKLRQAESLAALTTISAGIAHEIKNPLAAMSIHFQLIEQELKKGNYDIDSNFQFSLNALKDEIDRLNNIVIDYLFAVRPLKAELVLTNFNSFLNKFIDFIEPELDANNIKLVKKYKDLPDVWLDEKYFKQALLNLIKNSISAIKGNGIIKLEAFQKKNYIIINITDNGSGIPKEAESKIFDPYFTTKNFGTGLGLTIVYKIVKEHRGDISFSSKAGETVFSIKLPLTHIKEGLIEYRGNE